MISITEKFPKAAVAGEAADGMIYTAPDSSGGTDLLIQVPRGTEKARAIRPDALTMIGRLHKVNPDIYPAIADSSANDEPLFFAIKKPPGDYLADRIKDGVPVSVETALEICIGVSEALQLIHETGMYLGVIDGWSVVLDNGQVKIARYGLAPFGFSPGAVAASTSEAPELYRSDSKPDFRTDIYAVGALLWRLVTGAAWDSSKGKVTTLLSQSQLPPILQGALSKALDPNPANRFRTTGELSDTLRAEMRVDEQVKADEALDTTKPAIVVIEGQGHGARVTLSAKETVVGSNPGCDLTISKMPPQAFSIRYDGAATLLTRLGAAEVKLNGKQIKGANAGVARGDLITAGASVIKLIAPGEVFTLSNSIQSDSAAAREREFNRQVWPYLAATAIIGILGLGLFSWDVDKDERDALSAKAQSTKFLEKTIALLIEQGDGYFRDKQYRHPKCEAELCSDPESCMNAEECYTKVLSVVPDDHYVEARLVEIAELDPHGNDEQPDDDLKVTLVKPLSITTATPGVVDTDSLMQAARGFADKGQFVEPKGQNALENIIQVLTADPDNSDARDLVTELAAKAVNKGNQARKAADAPNMLKWYDVAEALGVSTDYLSPLRRGAAVIENSHSAVVIVDGPGTKSTLNDAQRKKLGYVDPTALSEKLAVVELESGTGESTGRTVEDAD